ncbi:MAG: ATP-binding protein [Myxococcota bacterium]
MDPNPVVVIAVGAGALAALPALLGGVRAPVAAVLVAPESLVALTAQAVERAGLARGRRLTGGAAVVVPEGARFDATGALVPGAAGEAPVDALLASAAGAHGRRVIAVVLSGTGADGRCGAVAVHEAGGIVLVEADPRIDERPRSVIATGAVDAVLPPDQLAHAIAARSATLSRPAGHVGRLEDDVRVGALVRSERFLRLLTDNLPATVSYWDADGRCRFANEAYRRWFGLDPAQMIGRPIRELFGEPLYLQNEGYIRGALAGDPQRYERVVPKEDGRVCHLLADYLPHRVDGELAGFFAIVTDISDQRAAERELRELNHTLEVRIEARTAERDALVRRVTDAQRLESLGALAGGLAHDFNNRLTTILAAAGELEDPDDHLPVTAQDAGRTIAEAARRAAELCRKLLAYSGRGSFVLDAGSLDNVVHRAVASLGAPHGVALGLSLSASLPSVAMDPEQMHQVVWNLARNAAEAVELQGGGDVTVRTGQSAEIPASGALFGEPPQGLHVYVEVSDTGGGIPEADLSRVFDPFFSTRFAGRGLGLSAVLGIVRGHGGALWVRSVPGTGTIFRVLLPPAPVRAERATPTNASSFHGTGVILLADDEEPVLRASARVLRRLGFEVDCVHDGHEAVVRFCADPERYALVVLDLTMPRMTGAEALVAIRAVRPAVRVLVMSGYASDDPTATFQEQRPDAFLAKPFELRAMADAVREALRVPEPA